MAKEDELARTVSQRIIAAAEEGTPLRLCSEGELAIHPGSAYATLIIAALEDRSISKKQLRAAVGKTTAKNILTFTKQKEAKWRPLTEIQNIIKTITGK